MSRAPFDASAIARAAERPGADPRVWIAMASVVELGHDPAEGHFADCWLMPCGPRVSCVVGGPYAGAGFGAHFPLKVDDVVLVAVPMGDCAYGPVIISRAWSRSDPPPPEAGSGAEPSADVSIVAEAGSSVRVVVSGAGDVVIEARGSGKVRLGGAAGALPPAVSDLVAAQLNVLKAAIAAAGTSAGDGGAAFKSSLVAALANWPASMAATKVEVL